MKTESKSDRLAIRSILARNPVALECARIAASFTSGRAEVVLFDEGRVFVAASSTSEGVLFPRPMTPAEALLAQRGAESGVAIHEGGLVIPIVAADGCVVAGLSVQGGDLPANLDGLHGLARLVRAELDAVDDETPADFHVKVLEGQRDAVIVLSSDLQLRWVSRGVVSLLGRSATELVGGSAAEYLHPDDIAAALNATARISQGLEVYRINVRLLNASGHYVPVEVTGTDMSSDESVGGMVLSLRDAQRETELGAEMDRTRRLSAAIVDGLRDGLVATDQYGSVTLVNDVAREMFGIDASVTPAQLTIDDFVVSTVEGRAHNPLDQEASAVRCLVSDHASVRYLDCCNQTVSTSEGELLARVMVFTDVTAEHRAAEELRAQALHDQLTGLPNRRQLEYRLGELVKQQGAINVAACFVDLDGFKLVNDNHGHRVGDQLIRVAAQRLAAELRDVDLLVRHGGDEFVALLVGVDDIGQAEAAAQRLRAAMSRPYQIGDERFDLTASVGVSMSSTTDLAADVLLQHADIAMYAAKDKGRNRVQAFDVSLAEIVSNEQHQRRILRDALDEDRLVMHFQPLVDTVTEDTTGYEALARLRTVDGELLTPAHFLEAIANTALMWELDQVAFLLSSRAAALLAKIRPEAPPYVACNFCSVSLTHPDFADFVVNSTNEAGVEPSQISIEITESAAFEAGTRSAAALQRLRSLGFQLALDDFGTGYSSLAHLRDLPITAVKVDRSFIVQLGTHGSERSIAEAVVGLARDLNLGVVAEGVETLEQLKHARDIGFGTIQGWHYAEAMPIDQCLDHWTASSAQPSPS